MTTTVDVLSFYTDTNAKAVMTFLDGVCEINILKLGTTVGNDLIADRLFTDSQDILMKFLITMLNVLREDSEFFTEDNSYTKDLSGMISGNLFSKEYCKLVSPTDSKDEHLNELLALYIMGGKPSRTRVFGQ